jgi:hypothetical protein
MDLENVFGLFSSNEDSYDSDVYIDFAKTPIYWIGMYKKLVLNNLNFNKKVVKFFKEANSELDVHEMSEAGEFVTYNRAWNYIKKIDIENKEHLLAIKKYADAHLDTSLKLGISFFQETNEQYEKCALLKKILDKSKEFQS